jgi:hypothetical protein
MAGRTLMEYVIRDAKPKGLEKASQSSANFLTEGMSRDWTTTKVLQVNPRNGDLYTESLTQ